MHVILLICKIFNIFFELPFLQHRQAELIFVYSNIGNCLLDYAIAIALTNDITYPYLVWEVLTPVESIIVVAVFEIVTYLFICEASDGVFGVGVISNAYLSI